MTTTWPRSNCRWGALATVMLLCLSNWPSTALSDEIRPALLELTERDGGWVDITWKVPIRGNLVLPIVPVLPEFFTAVGPASGRAGTGAWIEYSSWRTGGRSLAGARLGVDGLAGLSTDVLVRVILRDGVRHSAIIRAAHPSFTIPEQATRTEIAASYWRMGAIHILNGVDHLLFLLTLLLIVTGIWPLLKTVTAFTVAHSLTLALATLGFVNIQPAPTEAVISLSIMLLAVEVVRKYSGELTISERYPWLVAFTFGLVHGLGFAGALAEIGVPRNEVPLALLMFNVGVETGQVIFVFALSVLLAALGRLHNRTALAAMRAAPYAIGGIAAFWTMERVGSFI